MRQLYTCITQTLPQTPLGPFDEILALDATIVRLWDGLIDLFESTHDGQAAATLQMVVTVAEMTANRLKIHSARQHELHRWRGMGEWVTGRLLLIDPGYYSFWLFHRIHKYEGYFLSRLKSNCSLRIVEDLASGPGRHTDLVGETVKDALTRIRRKHVEWLVEVPVQLRSRRVIIYRWRVVGTRHPKTGHYHIYLTNAPAKLLECEDARTIYALRWQIEWAIKELKSVGRLHHLPTRKAEIVEVLILAALLFVMLSGWLRQQLFGAKKLWEAGMLRMLVVVRKWSPKMLELLAEPRESFTPRCMWEQLKDQCEAQTNGV